MEEVAAASSPPVDAPAPTTLPIAWIAANASQPRRRFEANALAELVDSIRERGVLQPILVRPLAANRYEIVAGERRWRAAQQAGLHEMPVVVRAFDDRNAFEIALVENIQRADLNPIEEAEGYARLVRDHGHSHDDIARAVGKSRSHISNLLRLLELPDGVREMVVAGRLSMGHARSLVGHDNAAGLAEKAASEGWSVRQTEAAARKGPAVELKPDSTRDSVATDRDPNLAALEESLAEGLGVRVRIVPGDEGPYAGTVSVEYSTLDQLDMICQRLLGPDGRFD